MKKGQRARLTLWNFFATVPGGTGRLWPKRVRDVFGRMDKCIFLKERHMNETKVNTNIGDVSSLEEKNTAMPWGSLGPCHQPHTWLLPELRNNHEAVFASTVVDVARGVGVIVSILGAHITDLSARAGGAGDDVRTLLSESDTEALARLAAFSLDELYSRAEGHVDALNAQAVVGARP